jgi:protein-S-isoprenylcysteine O-methyltransferase Ste14
VREGPYQRVGNPMYLSVLSMLLGEVIPFHSLSLLMMLLVAITVVHLFVIYYEEPHLTRQFAESYKEYLRTIPRWLPRFW